MNCFQGNNLNYLVYNKITSDSFSEFGDGAPNTAATAVGGLSVTGCLSDFSVYIFHPYGGKKSALKEAQWSPLSDRQVIIFYLDLLKVYSRTNKIQGWIISHLNLQPHF